MPKILLTGGSGFLGRHIIAGLKNEYDILTVGRSKSNNVVCDLGASIPEVTDYFDLVIHAAGKGHSIPKTKEEAEEFFLGNYQSTINLVKAVERGPLPKAFVYISSVAVYGVEEGSLITEDHPLNGDSPYAKAKISSENFLIEWCTSKNIKLTILRLPLVVGKDAPGNLGAMVRLMKRRFYLGIGKGSSKKSMVLADDVVNFLPQLAEEGGVYNLSDGYDPSILELENAIAKEIGVNKPMRLPEFLIRWMARVGDLFGSNFPINSERFLKLTSNLTFSDAKARRVGWNPRGVINHLSL